MAPSDVDIETTYLGATRLDVHELVRQLVRDLGPTLVATSANVRDTKLPHKWSKADGPTPRDEAYARLVAAHRAWTLLRQTEHFGVARNWFIGANPRLNERAPALCLREGAIAEVLAAANAFVDGTAD